MILFLTPNTFLFLVPQIQKTTKCFYFSVHSSNSQSLSLGAPSRGPGLPLGVRAGVVACAAGAAVGRVLALAPALPAGRGLHGLGVALLKTIVNLALNFFVCQNNQLNQ